MSLSFALSVVVLLFVLQRFGSNLPVQHDAVSTSVSILYRFWLCLTLNQRQALHIIAWSGVLLSSYAL